jgi:hypothetical protein
VQTVSIATRAERRGRFVARGRQFEFDLQLRIGVAGELDFELDRLPVGEREFPVVAGDGDVPLAGLELFAQFHEEFAGFGGADVVLLLKVVVGDGASRIGWDICHG